MAKANPEMNKGASETKRWYAIIPGETFDSDLFLDVFFDKESAEKVLDKWMEWGRWRDGWGEFHIISFPRWENCELEQIPEETIEQMRARRSDARRDFMNYGSSMEVEMTENVVDLPPQRPPPVSPDEVISMEKERRKKLSSEVE